MRIGRQDDASGSTAAFRNSLLEYQQSVAVNKREKAAKRLEKSRILIEKLEGITLLTCANDIHSLSNKQLDEQLDIHRKIFKNESVPKKVNVKTRKIKLDALYDAVDIQNEYFLDLSFNIFASHVGL